MRPCVQSGALAGGLINFSYVIAFRISTRLFFRGSSWQVDCLESTLEKSLQAKFPSDLKVSILLDFTRGSRGGSGVLPVCPPYPAPVLGIALDLPSSGTLGDCYWPRTVII